MKALISVFLFFVLLLIFSCKTITPVIIYEPPRANMHEEMTLEEYLSGSTRYRIEIESYLNELINQIKHKVPFIDLRGKKRLEEKK